LAQKILLIYPQFGTSLLGGGEETGVIKSKFGLAPPLGLLYLARELLDAGYDTEIIDFNSEEYILEKFLSQLKGVDLVGISALSYNSFHLQSFISEIRHVYKDLPIIVGGPDITINPRLLEGTNVSVVGEAEKTIVEIVETILKGGDLSQCRGVIYRQGDGIKWGKEPYVEYDLDSIKFPARWLLRSEEKTKGYNLLGRRLSNKITLCLTSRGCPFSCRFCAHRATSYNIYRERSVENILDELQEIFKEGFEILGMVDDNFTLNRKRLFRIMEWILERGINLTLLFEGRVDGIDEALLRIMRRAGVRGIYFGLESANQDVLDFYDKKTTVEQNRRAVKLADRFGFYTAGSFILGAPFENLEHFRRTIEFACSLPLELASFCGLEYAYGSRLYEEARRNGLIKQGEVIVRAGIERGLGRFSSQDIERFCLEAAKKFYFRPSYWMRLAKKICRTKEPLILRMLGAGLLRYLKGEL